MTNAKCLHFTAQFPPIWLWSLPGSQILWCLQLFPDGVRTKWSHVCTYYACMKCQWFGFFRHLQLVRSSHAPLRRVGIQAGYRVSGHYLDGQYILPSSRWTKKWFGLACETTDVMCTCIIVTIFLQVQRVKNTTESLLPWNNTTLTHLCVHDERVRSWAKMLSYNPSTQLDVA